MSDRDVIYTLANIPDGARVRLFPNKSNPLHRKPVVATYSAGYFYCEGTRPEDGPDYYFGDVFQYNYRIEQELI